MRRITLEEVKEMEQEMLTPSIVGRVIGCDPYYISLQARQNPNLLGFPVHVHGNRTLVPRRAFIRWMEGTA